jgi:hypothetical protein
MDAGASWTLRTGQVNLWEAMTLGRIKMEAKDTVRELLDRLPDDCSLEDILYHLYVVQSVNRGLADAEAGRTVSHEEVRERLRRKWILGAAE